MSERQEKKARYTKKLEFICAYLEWLEAEPSMVNVFAWARWKANKPKEGSEKWIRRIYGGRRSW